MSPSAVTNQCVAGTLATWAMMHRGDPRWNHPPPLFGNAIDLYGVARAQGFVGFVVSGVRLTRRLRSGRAGRRS